MSNIIDFNFYRKFHIILRVEKEDMLFFIEQSIKTLLFKQKQKKHIPHSKKQIGKQSFLSKTKKHAIKIINFPPLINKT